VPLVQGKNFATVDLFDTRHTRKVLLAFGRAFGCVGGPEQALSAAQEQFLDRAVDELAIDGRVIPVRLALFADLIKQRPWLPTTLTEVGGAAGIGVKFLEEAFAAPGANPRHRRHQQAARAVLQHLLPQQGTDLKGQQRSRAELQNVSDYADSKKFEE